MFKQHELTQGSSLSVNIYTTSYSSLPCPFLPKPILKGIFKVVELNAQHKGQSWITSVKAKLVLPCMYTTSINWCDRTQLITCQHVPWCRRLSSLEFFPCFPAITCRVEQKQVACQKHPDQVPSDISHSVASTNLKPEMAVGKNQPVTWSQGEPEASSFLHARILSWSSLREGCKEERPLLGGSILRSFLLFKARLSQNRSSSLPTSASTIIVGSPTPL